MYIFVFVQEIIHIYVHTPCLLVAVVLVMTLLHRQAVCVEYNHMYKLFLFVVVAIVVCVYYLNSYTEQKCSKEKGY